MKKSLTKWNKFFSSLFYAVLLALPMLSVLARVVYVQSNHNAKDSYSDKFIISENAVSNSTMLLNDYDYVLNIATFINDLSGDTGFKSSSFYYPKSEINWSQYANISTDLLNRVVQFKIVHANISYTNIELRDINNDLLFNITKRNSDWLVYNSNQLIIPFNLANSRSFSTDYFGAFLVQLQYKNISLDNAFEYSISKVIDDYGKGNINFVNWFGDMFFDNPQNLLYLNFVNMYLNYILLVSVAYLMYLFLSFFIQIIRELIFSFIDKTNKVGD